MTALTSASSSPLSSPTPPSPPSPLSPNSPTLCYVAPGQQLTFGYFQPASSCTYALTWQPGFTGLVTLRALNALQLTGGDSATDGSFVLVFTTGSTGSLCLLFYSLPGNVDYPFSIATALTVAYSPTPVQTAAGTAVTLLSAQGRRTYTNRFGAVSTTQVASLLSAQSPALLYLNASLPFDATGLTLNLSSPIQLPGVGPSPLTSTVTYYAAGGGVQESNSALLDALGTAWRSNLPSFLNASIGAANVNALAADYAACQAPISFTNGLRAPTQPTTFNGAVRFLYAYQLSDGANYSVQANLTVSTSSAFATSADALGNPYQTVTGVTGTRTYTWLATGATVVSQVSWPAVAAAGGNPSATPVYRFYPYTLLASAPGVYSANTAPYWDAQGLTYGVVPAAPLLGVAPGGAGVAAVTLEVVGGTGGRGGMLTEAGAVSPPVATLQQQTYALMS